MLKSFERHVMIRNDLTIANNIVLLAPPLRSGSGGGVGKVGGGGAHVSTGGKVGFVVMLVSQQCD